MTTMTDLTLTTARTIAAPAERLYAAWLDPAMLRRFMIAKPGATVPEAQADARVGGSFRIVMRQGGADSLHSGSYLALEPHRRIVFTWHSDHSVEGSTVTVTFTPKDGGTEVVLTQVKFASEGARDGHRAGWTSILAALAEAV